MNIRPLLDIHVPQREEHVLTEEMKKRAVSPWSWQGHDAFERPSKEGSIYFHRDEVESDPPCTICIQYQKPGHLIVRAIVPDANTVREISIDQYVKILREFDQLIAAPAAEGVLGMTSMGTSKHTLEDYFSAEAIRLLQNFCKSSNSSDFGSHSLDQEKWMDFLILIHRQNANVHCDTFGDCLAATGWWPEQGIRKLVAEYDFAMRLLQRVDY